MERFDERTLIPFAYANAPGYRPSMLEGKRYPAKDAPYAEDAPGGGFSGTAAYAEDAPSRGGLPTATAPAAAPIAPEPIKGAATRIQAETLRGSQGVPQMARTLAQESQQRFAPQQGVEGSIGVDGFMRQLQNIRALGQMDTPAGPGILGGDGPTWQERQNAEMTSKWAQEDRDQQFRSVLGGSGADARARMGAYTSYANAQNGADVQRQNALLGYQGGRERDASAERIAGSRDQAAFGLEGMRGKNQLAAYGLQGQNQLAAEGMRGANQLAAYGLQGQNQLANTRLGGEMQGENQMGLERFKQSDPKNAALMQYYTQLGDQAGATAEKARDELKFGKSLDGQYYKGLEQVSKLMNSGLTAQAEKLHQDLTEAYAFRQHQAKKKAAPESYADGGSVDAQHEADMRRRYEKAGLVYPGAPAPVQQAPVQQAPAPQQSWTDRLRGVATGGLDKRMQNYAQGGDVDMRQFMAESNKRQYAEGFRQNIEGVRTNYETFGRGQPAAKMQRRLDNYSDDAHAAVEQANREADNSTYRETRGAARYAGGGDVDVSGRQVFGVGSAAPTGPKSDTIPAVIDGTQPAALDHGEYVIPAEVVRKYGTDFFDKLLAKSRQGEGKGLDTGRNSA